MSFHSISFPSEWGVFCKQAIAENFHGHDVSIQLVSPASGEGIQLPVYWWTVTSFHSISFPSEWGAKEHISMREEANQVSIQLVSPASGESNGDRL